MIKVIKCPKKNNKKEKIKHSYNNKISLKIFVFELSEIVEI